LTVCFSINFDADRVCDVLPRRFRSRLHVGS
jgi:hypothetical protein